MLVALSRGTEDNIPTMMPTRIGALWITGGGISYHPLSTVNAHADAAFSGRRKATVSMFALYETTGNLLLSLQRAELTTVATREALSQFQIPKKRLCYTFVRKPDLDLLSRQQVLEYCESTRRYRTSEFEFFENIGFVLIRYMSDAIDALAEDDTPSPDSHLRQYIKWSKDQVDRFHAGLLPDLSNGHPKWKVLLQDTKYRGELLHRVESTKQRKVFVWVGQNLPQILKGKLDPLAFMFQDDSIPEFYREINDSFICYEPLDQFLDALSHKDSGLKILEIGAGTGATTDHILDVLSGHEEGDVRTPDCTQYDYTDISPAFLESAATRYGRH